MYNFRTIYVPSCTIMFFFVPFISCCVPFMFLFVPFTFLSVPFMFLFVPFFVGARMAVNSHLGFNPVLGEQSYQTPRSDNCGSLSVNEEVHCLALLLQVHFTV